MTLREDKVTPKEYNMDLWNNNIGIEEYHNWKDAYNSGQTTDSLEKWMYDVVKRGDTINDLEDSSKQWVETQDTLREKCQVLSFAKF